MEFNLGILLAFGALICWGFGDFNLQKLIRKLGDWGTLLIITLFGWIVLTPFVYKDLSFLFSFQDNSFLILMTAAVVISIAALLDFEALKQGKLAIVEPVLALEVPVSLVLSLFIIKETIGFLQLVLIFILILGLILVSLKSKHLLKRNWIERGVLVALLGALFMGSSNFLVGFASRITNPLLTNWFINMVMALLALVYLVFNKKVKEVIKDVKENKRLTFSTCILDNGAWVFFAFSMSLIPIAIAVAVSESYIALVALLGLVINKEYLMRHQKVGLLISLVSAIALAVISS